MFYEWVKFGTLLDLKFPRFYVFVLELFLEHPYLISFLVPGDFSVVEDVIE